MAIMLAKTYQAFKAAGVPEQDAIAAAEELPAYEIPVSKIGWAASKVVFPTLKIGLTASKTGLPWSRPKSLHWQVRLPC